MARSTDSLVTFRRMMGAAVAVNLIKTRRGHDAEIVLSLDTSATVAGLVWSPAPLDGIVLSRSTARLFRKDYGMERATSRDAVYVLATGGRVLRAEINTETMRGYAEEMRGSRHEVSDAEILSAATSTDAPTLLAV